MFHARVKRIFRGLILLLAMAGCAADPVHYGAAFNQPDGLGPGDAVTRNGASVGSVTAISPSPAGDTQVSVQVDHRYASIVYNDSILILQNAGASPSLELMTPDVSSGHAVDGTQLYGASNENQSQILINTLGPNAVAQKYNDIFNRYGVSQASPSPGNAVLGNQLMDLFRKTLAATGAVTGSTPTGQAQVAQMQNDTEAVARQLDYHEHRDQAARLREGMAHMAAGANAASRPPPNTRMIPTPAPTP